MLPRNQPESTIKMESQLKFVIILICLQISQTATIEESIRAIRKDEPEISKVFFLFAQFDSSLYALTVIFIFQNC